MAGIKLPIEVGQKFLSNGEVVEVISITRKHKTHPIVAIGETSGDVSVFNTHGKYFADRDNVRDLQPIPEPEIVIPEGVDFQITSDAMRVKCLEMQASGRVFSCYCDVQKLSFCDPAAAYRMLPATITEGVEFSGEAYRAEFERLMKDGRDFDRLGDNSWDHAGSADFSPDNQYRMRPQHRDAVGNPLKVGDRVDTEYGRGIILRFDGKKAVFDDFGWKYCHECRKLTTRTRPLCVDDLMQHRTALFKKNDMALGVDGFHDQCVFFGNTPQTYSDLQREWQWSPSADQPWGPCEVTEEVLA